MDARLQELKSLITGKTGLVIRDQDDKEFHTVITTRLMDNGLAGVDEYYRLLETSSVKSERKWKKLVSFLTVGESYFFRDQDPSQDDTHRPAPGPRS
jgi:chemotaxis protein methyltransferase CheR